MCWRPGVDGSQAASKCRDGFNGFKMDENGGDFVNFFLSANSVRNLRKQLLDFLFLISTLTRIELDIWNVWTHSCAAQTTLKWAGTSVPPRSPSCPAVAYAMPSGSQAVLGLAFHVSWPTSSHWQRPLQPSALQGVCKLTCMNALYPLSCFWHFLTFWQDLNFTTCTVIWHVFFFNTCFIVCVIACLYILWFISLSLIARGQVLQTNTWWPCWLCWIWNGRR